MNGAASNARSAEADGVDGMATTTAPRSRRSLSPAPAPKKKRSFWRKLWIWTQVVMAVVIIAASIAAYFVYQQAQVYYQRAKLIDLSKLNDVNETSTFLDVNGEELGRIFVEDRVVLKADQIPDLMRKAVLSAEDRRFYEHGAIDYWGILRAVREDFGKKGRTQGASTIEQQLAKHLIGDFSRTLDRKFLEAFVAVRLEQNYSKDEILNYYMNRIYFGKGYFGIESAAKGYFGKDASELSLPECALLAGIIRAPVTSSPRTDIAKARVRRDLTLHQMLEEGFITHDEYSGAVRTPVRVIPAKPSGLQTFVMAAAVKEMEQILSIEGTEEMPQGLTVRTNIDLRLQRALELQMEQHLVEIETSTQAAGAPAMAPLNPALTPPRPLLQGSAIVADLDTGRVRAWIGGRDFLKNQFDHVSMARRENGALLQPMIYGLAFDRLGLSPASMIKASYLDPTAPATADDLALGNPNTDLTKTFLSIQDALAMGSRASATRVALQLGPHSITQWLRSAGVEARIPTGQNDVFNPSPMTLGDMAEIYQVLGNDGIHRKLKIIQSITSQDGQVLYDDSKPDHDQDQLLDIVNDEQLTLTLQNSLRTGFARTLTRDYGLRAPVAGMPGYSEGYRDAWFVGYTPKVLAGVWIGYDDSRPIGDKTTAMKSAVPLWGDLMREVLARNNGGAAFAEPGLTKVEIDRSTGALRGLAGLAPAPGDIFVYLKKDQVDAVPTTQPGATTAPHEWSDWLTTMFNDADETGLPDGQLGPGTQDKRSNIIPPLAEYKMPGLRGDIVGSDGTVYATMKNQENLVVKWPASSDSTTDQDILTWMRARFDEVNKTIGVPVTVGDADLLAQYHTQRYQPFTVLEDITPTQADQIRAAGLEAKGFGFVGTPRRIYPRGSELAHVLGYLSRDQQRNKGKYLSGDVIYDRYKGAKNSGLEYEFDKDLTGAEGSFMISTTPDGYARTAAVSATPGYGNTLKLAIDPKIQAAAEKALNRKRMDAWVMMDIHNGNIVAMASHPTFDPNIFLPTIAPDEWQLLNSDPHVPMLNRAIDAQFPPGSTFKTVTSIAAMVAGVFDPDWVVHCVGYFDIGNMHMTLKEEKGDVTYKEALTHSFNTYFATLGLKVGRDVLLDTARSFNFGNKTGIDLPGELSGIIPDSEYVRRVHQRDFGGGDVVLTAIGQGDVLVTPVQMADYMAALANGGTLYRPRLVTEIDDHNGNKVRDIPVDTLRTVTLDSPYMANLKEGMVNVVDEGTATVVHRDDMKIAAKTGTAQVGSKTKPRQVAWLCGYLPADNPQYAFAVMIQGEDSDNHGLGLDDGLLGGHEGGEIAAHIFDDVYGLPPNAKRRADEYDDYNKNETAPLTPPVADNDSSDTDSDDQAATNQPAEATTGKSTVSQDADSDATGVASTDNTPRAEPVEPHASASSKR